MDINLYLSFIIISFGIIIIPGPNVLVIISTSIRDGRLRGLQTVAGTSCAMAIQLIIAAFATNWFIGYLGEGFYLLKWFGIIYLVYLGITHLKQAINVKTKNITANASTSFCRGFWISLTNPKTILFFSAFLPQFAGGTGNYPAQIGLLSVTFLCMAIVLDSSYALLSTRLRSLLSARNTAATQNYISGILYLCAGAWLAALRRSS